MGETREKEKGNVLEGERREREGWVRRG